MRAQCEPGMHVTFAQSEAGGGASGTQAATGGQGSFMHMTGWASQWVPAAHRTAAHGSVVGGGLHLQVGQPEASSTLPCSQKIWQTGPHTGGGGGTTHAQIVGEGSKTSPFTHSTFSTHWQIPPQSAPPLFGSQLSLGLSTQVPPPGHFRPAIPPQVNPGGVEPPPPLEEPPFPPWITSRMYSGSQAETPTNEATRKIPTGMGAIRAKNDLRTCMGSLL